MLIYATVNAQVIQIGTGTTNPIGSSGANNAAAASPYGYTTTGGTMGKKMQIIYTAAQINAALTTAGLTTSTPYVISTTSWDVSTHTGNAASWNNYTIKMANVGQTNFASASTPYTGASSTVFGPSTVTWPSSGTGYLVTNTLASTFTWDGSSSLLVEVCYTGTTPGVIGAYGGTRRTATTGSNQIIYTGGASVTCGSSTFGTVVAAIPNMRITVGSACSQPSPLATSMNFTSLNTSSVQVNWTNGGGASRVVVAHATTAVSAGPGTGTDYSAGANSAFGSGTNLGSNNYVVYAGTGSSVNVTGLTGGTTYFFSVYEASATFCYSGGLSGSQLIPPCLNFPSANATSMVFSTITNNALTLSYTRGNGSNVLVVARLTATAKVQPTFNTTYTANTAFGSGQITGTGNFVVANGTANTVTVTGLANLTAYSFDVYEYNTSPNCYSPTSLTAGTSTLDGTTSGGCAASVVRTTGASAYSAITPATVISNGTVTTGYYQGGALNTPGSGIPIGFNFMYGGTTYTTFGLGVNGYIWFGSGVPSPTATYPIGNASANLGGSGTIDGIICAAGVYLENANNTTAGTRSIGYTVSGSAPNRVLTIQWQAYSITPGFSSCNGSGFNDGNRLDFQIQLNENGGTNSNKIGIAYRDMQPYCVAETGATSIVQVGLRGADNTTFINRTGGLNLSGSDWVATAGTINSQTCNMDNSLHIAGNYIVGNVLLTFTQAATTGPTVNGFASGGTASNSCPATSVLLTAGAGFGSYQWFLNGTIIPGPGSSASTYTATQSGSYTVVGKSGTCYLQSNAFTVTINSCGTPPSFTTCPGNQSANTSGACNAVVSYTTATSGTPAPTLSYSFSGATTGTGSGDGSGSAFNVGTTAVTVTATNGTLPDATCTFNVVVTDNENPVPAIASLPDLTDECSVSASTPTATDNCAGTVTASTTDPTSYTSQGSFVIHWSYNDGNGNVVTQNQNVIIDDNTNPVINNCPGNITSCNPVVSWTAPIATDNCGSAALSSNYNPGATFPLGTTTVNYTADDGHGNTAACSFDVTINSLSTDPTSATSDSPFNGICTGGSINLTVNGGTLGTGAVWNWYSGSCTGTLVGTGATITVSPTTTTTYFAKAVGACNTTNCVQITITVTSATALNGKYISSLTLFGGSPLPPATCNGNVLQLQANGISSFAGLFYQWTKGTNSGDMLFSNNAGGPWTTTLITSTNSVYVQYGALPNGYSGYRTCVQGITPCQSTLNFCPWIQGTLNTPSSITGPTVVCPPVALTYTAAASAGAFQYRWTFQPDAGAIQLLTVGTTVETLNIPNYVTSAKLCVTAELSCGAGSGGAPRCITLVKQIAPLGAISGNSPVCPGSTNTYSIAPLNGATSYSWTTPGGNFGNLTSVNVTFPSPYTGSGQVCVTANGNCSAPVSKCKSITTSTPPVPGNITGPLAGVCAPAEVSYSIASVGASTYTWTYPTGPSTYTSVTGNTSINFFAPAGLVNGTVSVVANNVNCTPVATSAVRSIPVKGAPARPTFITTQNGQPYYGCPTLFTTNFTSGLSYLWSTSLGPAAIEPPNPNTSGEVVITWGSGTASVNVTASNACGASGTLSQSFAGENGGCRLKGDPITDNDNDILSVYPNPAHNLITIKMLNKMTENNTVKILDLSGRLVLVERVQLASGISYTEVNLTGFAKGTYILAVENSMGINRQRIVVE